MSFPDLQQRFIQLLTDDTILDDDFERRLRQLSAEAAEVYCFYAKNGVPGFDPALCQIGPAEDYAAEEKLWAMVWHQLALSAGGTLRMGGATVETLGPNVHCAVGGSRRALVEDYARASSRYADLVGVAGGNAGGSDATGPTHSGKAGEARQSARLNDSEQNILEALGEDRLTGEKLAVVLSYPYNSNFKATLSSLVKRDILINRSDASGRGYEKVKRPDSSQD